MTDPLFIDGSRISPGGSFENYLQAKQITSYISPKPWGWHMKEPS